MLTELASQVAYYAKYVDEHFQEPSEVRSRRFRPNLLVADPGRCEPKKFGGKQVRVRGSRSLYR